MEPVKSSEVFGIIERINKKLVNLRSVLEPITRSTPTTEKDTPSPTQLMDKLTGIENQITSLLDTIEL
jgi:hypothetical protein